ncbi:UPF0481 protein At3g47200-like [Rosa rugosa]|uniref:UPF0481 protein At3g47200-like n=1 Tax=Rosa rugosa TaxID=74645 RepID=UPI002B404861|nr:UPF0481 protein At3g47200-like [Rosa rugosa]
MARNEDMASMNEAPERIAQFDDKSSKEELFKQIKGAKERIAQFQSSKPKIQRVPYMLRDHPNFEKYSEKYYEPRAVAIGPFHHGKPRCQLAEKFKLALADKFIKDSGSQVEDLHKIIEVNINTLKDCYDEEATRSYTDEALTNLLFLDGCSTLQFIYSLMENELASFNIKRDQVAFAEQDLFLLENQLPYQVLKLLMSLSDKERDLKNAIDGFVGRNIMAAGKKWKWHKHKKTSEPGDGVIDMEHKKTRQPGDGVIDMEEPTHLLGLLRTEMLGPPKSVAEETKDKHRRQSFRNIQELKPAGIHLRRSKTGTLRDISFTQPRGLLGFVGFLYLPPISVDDSMRPKFLNLIAYEMCPDFQNDFGVTSYICFLDSLIDHADDVKQLRSARVLHNLLGSDEEVAQLFNEIGTDLVPNSETYRSVKSKLEKHYKNRGKTWMAQFCHDHFSSPWTILAFLGVLAALGLSGIQTWYTINSPSSACELEETAKNRVMHTHRGTKIKFGSS